MPVDLAALLDPGHTAVVTSEVQRGVVGERSALPALAEAARPVVPNIARLCEAARAARAPVVGNDYVAMLSGADLPHLQRVVVLRHQSPPEGTVGWDDLCATGNVVDRAALADRLAALGPGDRSDLLFTSGTTGRPKGVVQTHGQTLRAFQSWADVVGLDASDRYLIVNPFFHAFGYKAGIVACLLTGATMVPLPVFDIAAVMATIAAELITVLPGPPTLYQSILASPERSSLGASSLRLAVTGAAVVPVSLVEQMRSVLGFATVVTGYGLTTMCRHDDDAETIATTSGRAIPDVEVQVVDDAGAEVGRPAGQGRGAGLQRDGGVLRGLKYELRGRAAADVGRSGP